MSGQYIYFMIIVSLGWWYVYLLYLQAYVIMKQVWVQVVLDSVFTRRSLVVFEEIFHVRSLLFFEDHSLITAKNNQSPKWHLFPRDPIITDIQREASWTPPAISNTRAVREEGGTILLSPLPPSESKSTQTSSKHRRRPSVCLRAPLNQARSITLIKSQLFTYTFW